MVWRGYAVLMSGKTDCPAPGASLIGKSRATYESVVEGLEVILFYNGLDVPTRQIIDLKGAIPSKTAADVKVAIQEWLNTLKKGTMEYLGQEDVNKVKAPTIPKIAHSKKKVKPLNKLTTLNLVDLSKEGDIKQQLQDSTRGKMQTLQAYSYGASHIDNSIPRKEKDPGSFTLPYYINNVFFDNALSDLGSSISVMPLSTYLNLDLGELAHSKLIVELANRTEISKRNCRKRASRSLYPLYGDYIELNDLNVPLELRRNQVDDLMPTIKECEVIDEPMIDIIKTRNNKSFDEEFYNSIMRDKVEYKGNNVVRAFMNVPIFVGIFSVVIHFAVVENIDGYRDQDMGDMILGELFCKASCAEARSFDGLITIHNGSDNVTYQMARSNPRFKHLSNAQCNKIKPLLKVSVHDKLNGISHPYQNLNSFYNGVLNLGPEYVREAKIEEWLIRGHDLAAKKSTKLVKYRSSGILLIMEYLVMISKKGCILEFKHRHLKITVLTSYRLYPSRKIWHICACTSLKTLKEQGSIRNGYTKETICIKYKWVLPRCSTCLIYGHSLVDCPKDYPKQVVNGMDKGKGRESRADDEGFIEVKKKKLVGKKHGRMMLDSIDNGSLVYPTVEENRQTRPKKYSELTEAQQLQDDCDVQATNIILHGLPPDGETLKEMIRLIAQQSILHVVARSIKSYAGTGNRGIATTSKGNVRVGPQRVMKCYNCQGEGHMVRQCTQPKRPRMLHGFKEKLMLIEAQERNLAFQPDDLDAYDSNCDDLSSTKAILMENLSSCDLEVLSEGGVVSLKWGIDGGWGGGDPVRGSLVGDKGEMSVIGFAVFVFKGVKFRRLIGVGVLKDTFNAFDKTLLDEITEVQTVFNQMEAAVDQCSSCVNDCKKCLELEIELFTKKDFVEKEAYDKLVKSYSNLEKHCISLELATQLNQEIFQRDNSGENLNAPTFNQLFKINELKAQVTERTQSLEKVEGK
ncbi:homeodomain-like protein [Tanacetum coccineum]